MGGSLVTLLLQTSYQNASTSDHLVAVYVHVAGDYVCGVCVNWASPYTLVGIHSSIFNSI